MTDIRERQGLAAAMEAALTGGPERHHRKTAEQGKLPVRERVARLIDPDSLSEEAVLANWEVEGLGTDQVRMFPGRRGAGRIFFTEVLLSGKVPQVCLLFGPSAAGGAYIPAFCDV